MNRLVIELLSIEREKAYGFHEYVFNLLDYFYNHREDIKCKKIVVLCKDTSAILFEKYSDRFDICSYPYNSFFKRYWLQMVAPIRLNLGKNDLLFTPGNYSGFIKCCPELLVIHDLLFKRKNWIPGNLMRWQRELYMPISVKKADKIVAISQFTKDDVEHYYPQAKGKIVVIHNSMNFSKFDGEDDDALGFDYFMAVSNNANYKNQATILKAFNQYAEKGGTLNLILIGKISPESDCGRVFAALPQNVRDRIIRRCNITNKELGSLYRGASCFISASKFEGFGMPVVEAMSFGLPVILSDIQPHREVSMNKGDFFEAEDYEKLSSRMLNMDFERKDYAQDIRQMFSEENTSAKYVELINHLGADLV